MYDSRMTMEPIVNSQGRDHMLLIVLRISNQPKTTALILCFQCLLTYSTNGEEPQALGEIELILALCCVEVPTAA